MRALASSAWRRRNIDEMVPDESHFVAGDYGTATAGTKGRNDGEVAKPLGRNRPNGAVKQFDNP